MLHYVVMKGMFMAKDNWDKIEIGAKIGGSILIPIVVGVSVAVFNYNASKRATAAQMTNIAVGVLMAPIEENSSGKSALRTWAIDVLKKPGEVVPLTEDAATQLYFDSLPNFSPRMSEFDAASLAASITEAWDALDEYKSLAEESEDKPSVSNE